MCKWGTIKKFKIRKSINGNTLIETVGVDSCIAALVQALNNAGIETVASCCGHGNRPGNIALADGRELIIAPDYKTSRRVDKAFPDIWGEK